MAIVIPFPNRKHACVPREPSLRETLVSRGIEPTADERRRKRREREAARRRASAISPPEQI